MPEAASPPLERVKEPVVLRKAPPRLASTAWRRRKARHMAARQRRPSRPRESATTLAPREAARELGVNQGNISDCCRGKRETAGGKDGRRWRFCRDIDAGEPECIEGEEWPVAISPFYSGLRTDMKNYSY